MKHGCNRGGDFPGRGRTWKDMEVEELWGGKNAGNKLRKGVVHMFVVMLVLMISLYNDSCKGNPKRDAIFYSFCWGM